MIVKDRQINAIMKEISAIFSNLSDFFTLFTFNERKDSMQLNTRQMEAIDATSSIIVAEPNRPTLIDVIITRQKPSKLADVLSICGDLLFKGIEKQQCCA